jgi:hypothetical protein
MISGYRIPEHQTTRISNRSDFAHHLILSPWNDAKETSLLKQGFGSAVFDCGPYTTDGSLLPNYLRALASSMETLPVRPNSGSWLQTISSRIFAHPLNFLFSNYEAWLHDPIHVRPSSQVAWPGLNQDVLNGDQGGGFSAIRITSGFFHLWRGAGILSEAQLFDTAIGSLLLAWLMLGAGWFHYHRSVPTMAWFNDVDSMLNHHLAGLLGLGSLGWAGHLVHVACPVNN